MADGINATPAARVLAAAHGIPLADVTATGATGVVVADVEAAIAAREDGAPSGRMALKEGSHTFHAPGHLGGATLTFRAGEAVPAALFQHVPAADRDRYAPLG